MALRVSRLLTTLVAGGLVTGSVLLGAGSALAAPAGDVVPARCGQTVRAQPGDTVAVTPTLGLPFTVPVVSGMDPISQLLGGVLCQVQVIVVEPVASAAAQAAPPLAPAVGTLTDGTGSVLAPSARARATPRSQAAATTPAPAVAPAPALTPQQAGAAAPAFAPAFGTLPSSFLRSASAGPAGAAPGLRYDAGLLLGSAFPGLRAGAPAYLGYDAASAVTTASQVQALPVDGLQKGGVGVPALLAVLALSGVAAFTVRRIVLGRAVSTGPATPELPESGTDDAPADDLDTELADLTDAEDVGALVPAGDGAPARV